jgi:hypothetical protein
MTLDLGSYSHGTLRDCDLAETLADMLREVSHDDDGLLADLDAIVTHDDDDDDDPADYPFADYASDTINTAMDALQDYAPPFCYVGMHEGDCSDLGVWFSHDAFEYACRCGEVLKIGDSSEIDDMAKEEIASYNYIAIVSDHGNVSLFNVKVTLGDEVFSLV